MTSDSSPYMHKCFLYNTTLILYFSQNYFNYGKQIKVNETTEQDYLIMNING